MGPEATAHSVVECFCSGLGLKRGNGRARSDSAVECGASGRDGGASRKVTLSRVVGFRRLPGTARVAATSVGVVAFNVPCVVGSSPHTAYLIWVNKEVR